MAVGRVEVGVKLLMCSMVTQNDLLLSLQVPTCSGLLFKFSGSEIREIEGR